jgi:hypothetical protein
MSGEEKNRKELTKAIIDHINGEVERIIKGERKAGKSLSSGKLVKESRDEYQEQLDLLARLIYEKDGTCCAVIVYNNVLLYADNKPLKNFRGKDNKHKKNYLEFLAKLKKFVEKPNQDNYTELASEIVGKILIIARSETDNYFAKLILNKMISFKNKKVKLTLEELVDFHEFLTSFYSKNENGVRKTKENKSWKNKFWSCVSTWEDLNRLVKIVREKETEKKPHSDLFSSLSEVSFEEAYPDEEAHAEIKIAINLSHEKEKMKDDELYIGISKLTCFVCEKTLKTFEGNFSTYGTHAKTYKWKILSQLTTEELKKIEEELAEAFKNVGSFRKESESTFEKPQELTEMPIFEQNSLDKNINNSSIKDNEQPNYSARQELPPKGDRWRW